MLPPTPVLTIKNLARKAPLICLGLVAILSGCAPPGPRDLLEGKRLVERGNYQQAVEKLKTATALLSTNAQAWNYLGVACQYTGQAADARKAYELALKYDPDLTEAHYNLGCLWLAQNQLEAARSEFTAYTLRRSSSVEGFVKLGVVQLRCAKSSPAPARGRELEAAERSFSEALRLSPRNPEALNDLGLVKLQRARIPEALQLFDAALKARPGYGPALLNLAVVSHQYSRDHQLALQKYREYLNLNPTPADAESVKATMRELEEELSPTTRPAPPAVPVPAPVTSTLAKLPVTNANRVAAAPWPEPLPSAPKSSSVNNPSKPPTPQAGVTSQPPPPPAEVETVKLSEEPALKPAQDVAATPVVARDLPSQPQASGAAKLPAPTPAPVKRSLFQRLFGGGDKAPARSGPYPPQVGLVEGPGDAPVSVTSSSGRYAYRSPAKPASGNREGAERAFAQGVEAQQGRHFAEALKAYRQATELDPGFYEAHYNFGLAACAAGDPRLALAAYENALALRPDNLDARYNFGLALQQAGYPLDAAGELEKVLAKSPYETRAHLALANLCAHQLRQPARARHHYLKVLETDPHNPQAEAIRRWLADNP